MLSNILCKTIYISVVFLSLSAFVDIALAKGGRGGGGARGGARSGYSARSSSSSSSSSRGSYSRSSGSRLTSSYITSYQTTRYSRSYSSYRGYYYYYYNQYFYYSPTYAYYRRPGYSDSDAQGVCVNYEGTTNGTVMGVFTCPLPFEPRNFTACCGEQYAEYCCEPTSGNALALGLGLGLGGAVVIALLIACCCCCCCCKKKEEGTVFSSGPQEPQYEACADPHTQQSEYPPEKQNPYATDPSAPPAYDNSVAMSEMPQPPQYEEKEKY